MTSGMDDKAQLKDHQISAVTGKLKLQSQAS